MEQTKEAILRQLRPRQLGDGAKFKQKTVKMSNLTSTLAGYHAHDVEKEVRRVEKEVRRLAGDGLICRVTSSRGEVLLYVPKSKWRAIWPDSFREGSDGGI